VPPGHFGKVTIIVCGNDRENMILIGLGSNLTTAWLKSSQEVLEEAIKTIEKNNIKVVGRSSWYRSAPVPPSEQPWFVNGVAQVETSLLPQELLAALHQVADPSEVPTLPGARTIVRVWTRRGLTGERLAPELRLALAEELRFWRQDGAHVAQLARLLRWHHVEQATRVSGALDGALLAIGRDRRLLELHDEASARRVLDSAETRALLRAAQVLFF